MAKATDFFPIPSSLFTKKPSPFHMGLYFQKVPTVNPSVKNQRFLPAPFDKGALRRAAADNFAPGWSVIVTSLTRPVSFYVRYRAFSDFQSTARERSTPKPRRLKRGQGLKTTTRAKAKGQSRLVPPGDSQGGSNSSGSELFPP